MKQWVLASRPVGVVKHDDFALQQADVPNISENEVLLKTLYLGVAPVMQRYMSNQTTLERPMSLGDVMLGRGVGQVVASNNVN